MSLLDLNDYGPKNEEKFQTPLSSIRLLQQICMDSSAEKEKWPNIERLF